MNVANDFFSIYNVISYINGFVMFKNKKKKTIKFSILGAISALSIVPVASVAVANYSQSLVSETEKTSMSVQENTTINNENNVDDQNQIDGNQGSVDNHNTSEGDRNINSNDPVENGYDLIPIGATGISLKVPNFSKNPEKAQLIQSTYRYQPSSLDTNNNDPTNIANVFNILHFDSEEWNLTDNGKKPTIFNLGSVSTYRNNLLNAKGTESNNWLSFSNNQLVDTVSLPAFDKANDQTQPINQKYLDDQGVLALQINLYNKNISDSETTYYVMIPGFNTALNKQSMSGNPMLPSSIYVQNIRTIDDNVLLDNIKFDNPGNNDTLNKSVVSGTRVNNIKDGTISLDADFTWQIPETIKFSTTFVGVISHSRANSVGTSGGNVVETYKYVAPNDKRVETNWNKKFSFTGFQPSPNISNTQVLEIIGFIMGGVGLVVLVGYGLTKLSRYYRQKHTM